MQAQSKGILVIQYKYLSYKIHKKCTFLSKLCKNDNKLRMINIAIFASGSGSNAENIIKYFQDSSKVCVKTIISNKSDAYVLERAKKYDISYAVFDRKGFVESNELLNYLKEQKIEFIVLAGFLLKVPEKLVKEFKNRIVNIHPALLPKYGGKGMYGDNVHKAVVEAREKETGITIHFVDEEYDRGSIIFQASTEIDEKDDYLQVAEKVHQLEYQFFPKIIDQTIDQINF